LFLTTLPIQVLCINFQVLAKSSLSFDANGAKNRPVTKVIALLKDMQKQLEKEAEEDEEIYEKMACWCETNDKEKTKAIADAEARIEDLTSQIEELSATSARLNTEIKNLEKEVEANQKALDQATAIRTKELAEFNEEEKDMLSSISALKAAITVLSKHHGEALLQSMQMQVATTIQHELTKHWSLLDSVLTPAQKKIASALVQSPEDYFDAEPTFKQSYAPASGQIYGILKQMKETFESNLSQSQKDELANQKAYEELKAAKEDEIQAAQDQIDVKSHELALTDEKLAQAKQDLEDTRNSLSADEKFLMNLKETCQMTDQEWEARQKDRQMEIEAVSKALAVLTSDDAHSLFTKTFNPAFLEKKNSQRSQRQAAASKLLSQVAKKLRSPRLTAMALKVRLDAFTRVKKAIDDMITTLLKEKDEEIKHKDYCVNGFNENAKITENKQRDLDDLKAVIADLTSTIDALTTAIDTLKGEIAEMQTQMKRAGEDREKENEEFQLTVADQRATQKLLAQALSVLKGVYGKKAKAALLQESQDQSGPPPPPGFKEYKKNSAAGGVMGMIEGIIQDAKAMEAEAMKSEDDAQKAYEEYVTDTNDSIAEKSKDIVNKSEELAVAEGDKTEALESKENLMLEIEQLSYEEADLHKASDFLMKNFDLRQSARDQEVEALKQAKAILSGAKFSEFLQV